MPMRGPNGSTTAEIPRARWDLDEFYEPDVQRALAALPAREAMIRNEYQGLGLIGTVSGFTTTR